MRVGVAKMPEFSRASPKCIRDFIRIVPKTDFFGTATRFSIQAAIYQYLFAVFLRMDRIALSAAKNIITFKNNEPKSK